MGLRASEVKIVISNIQLKPSFLVDYSVNADFSTSVGRIHSVHATTHILLDETGDYIGDTINNALYSADNQFIRAEEIENLAEVAYRGLFERTNTEIRELAKQLLINRHTQTVGYYGRNHVHYFKTCTPKPKDVQISKVQKVYIPIWSLVFSLYGNKYSFNAIEGSTSELTLLSQSQQSTDKSVKSYPYSCMTCSSTFFDEGKFVCLECGKISCSKHTFVCKKCGKQICLEHTLFKRRLLILKDKYCKACYDSLLSESR